MSQLVVREMRLDEVPAISGFPPPEWSFDAPAFFGTHFGRTCFHPIVAEEDGRLTGIANALVFGDTAWLGNIIVAPEYRHQGIGAALTGHLVDHCRKRGCRSQFLIATPLGRSVYVKFGFIQTGEYLFLKPVPAVDAPDFTHIRSASPGDLDAISLLDRKATAEDRRVLVDRFLDGGFVHWSGTPEQVDGFYLPSFGQGPVIAENEHAGLALLQLKHHKNGVNACIPAGNRAAIEFLAGRGFIEDHRAPRMALGRDAPWHQDMIYARAARYCG